MKNIFRHIKKLFLEILPAFIFFLIMFHLLVVTKALTLKQYGISVPSSAVAIIGALIIAKVILIANRLPFLNLYPKKPLIWNVVLKTLVFSAAALGFLVAEELVHLARRYGGFSAALGHVDTDIIWPAFWVRDIWLTVLLFFYCAAVELFRVIGTDRAKEIFFGSK